MTETKECNYCCMPYDAPAEEVECSNPKCDNKMCAGCAISCRVASCEEKFCRRCAGIMDGRCFNHISLEDHDIESLNAAHRLRKKDETDPAYMWDQVKKAMIERSPSKILNILKRYLDEQEDSCVDQFMRVAGVSKKQAFTILESKSDDVDVFLKMVSELNRLSEGHKFIKSLGTRRGNERI